MIVRNVVNAIRDRSNGRGVPVELQNGANGANGWTPVLAPELDGTRTLLKVMDWTGGGGAKPPTGMYLGAAGYVTAKADAFNFNAAKRVAAASAVTNNSGVAAINYAAMKFSTAPVVIALPATTAVLSGPTRTTISAITKDGCTATVQQAALLTGIVSLLAGATANVLIIES